MESDALTLRRAALALMDAADLLEEGGDGNRATARARVGEVVSQLETVFWPGMDREDTGPDSPSP